MWWHYCKLGLTVVGVQNTSTNPAGFKSSCVKAVDPPPPPPPPSLSPNTNPNTQSLLCSAAHYRLLGLTFNSCHPEVCINCHLSGRNFNHRNRTIGSSVKKKNEMWWKKFFSMNDGNECHIIIAEGLIGWQDWLVKQSCKTMCHILVCVCACACAVGVICKFVLLEYGHV